MKPLRIYSILLLIDSDVNISRAEFALHILVIFPNKINILLTHSKHNLVAVLFIIY